MNIVSSPVEFRKLLFVINPIAGGKDQEDLQEELKKQVENTYKVDFLYTTGEDDENNIKAHIKRFDPEAVIAVGGDGTVSLVAQLLAGTDRIMGILPTGSGNGLSKDMEVPQNDVMAALNALLDGRIVKIDTLEANGHFFMHLADVGFNARIVKLYDNSDSRGLRTYMRFVLREFFNYYSHYYEVITDNGSFKGNAFMITVANSQKFGSNLTINPDGDWSDGHFEIVIIRSFPKKEGLKLLWQLLTKRIKLSPHSVILKCTKATVKCRSKRTLQYDGEVAGKFHDINFTLSHENLNIIVP